MSMAYWQRRSRQETQPSRVPRGLGTSPRTPQGQGEQTGGIQVQGNGTGSARSLLTASQRMRKRSKDPLYSSTGLTRASIKGRGGAHRSEGFLCAARR